MVRIGRYVEMDGGSNRRKGSEGEELASRYLRRHGYRILERNYRHPYGELDLIACKRGVLVFCEVKTRCGGDVEEALGAVDRKRQERMAGAASFYLSEKGYEGTPGRFDVIALLKRERKWKIVHVRDAFAVEDM